MPAPDNCSMTVLIMFELFGTIGILAFATICIYYRRFFIRKSLNGRTVLITNGDSSLSKELSHQLAAIHNCRVILIRNEMSEGNNINNNLNSVDNRNSYNSTVNEYGKQTKFKLLNDIDLSNEPASVSAFNCNLLENSQLERCARMTHKLYGEIDVLIENKVYDDDAHAAKDCTHFVNSTSDSIRSTINLLIYFIPRMSHSSHGGQFITIHTNDTVSSASLSTRPELRELIKNLINNQSVSENTNRSLTNVQLSSVILNRRKQCEKSDNSSNSLCNNNHNCSDNVESSILSIKEIAESILENIERQRKIINIFEERSQTAKFCNFFKNKFKKNNKNVQ